jgi:hypothetical protein
MSGNVSMRARTIAAARSGAVGSRLVGRGDLGGIGDLNEVVQRHLAARRLRDLDDSVEEGAASAAENARDRRRRNASASG